MSMPVSASTLLPDRETRTLLIKWTVALLVPLAIFTFIWSGEAIVNTTLLGFISPTSSNYDTPTLIQLTIFILVFYAAVIAFAAYLIAVDTGRRTMLEVWLDILIFAVVPIFLVMEPQLGLIIGLALSALIWGIYFYVRNLVRKMVGITPAPPLQNLAVLDTEQQAALVRRAIEGGFWFAVIFALLWLIVDLVFFFTNTLPPILLIWVALRTILLPVAGYFLGRLSGVIALRRALPAKESKGNGKSANASEDVLSKRHQLEVLSTTRAREEAKDLVPNDLPLRSAGAQRFFLILLVVFLLFYPVLDPILFGSGTNGRLAGYGDAGYYVILALGLNIVVGFAGLLDLGYVAFFAIGAYVWGMVGSTQFTVVTRIVVNPQIWPWFFWPMIIVAALIAAFWAVVFGVPTLRLRGDYLAIVTLGFGEIIPIFFLELDKYTNGTNGIVGVQSPSFPGVFWSIITPMPYYYLILALIGLTIIANIRLRDSRLGRAWIAIREDEIAAASSGVNLVRTKLFAFAAGR